MTESSDAGGEERVRTSGPQPEPSQEAYDGQDEPSYVSDDQLPEDLRPSEDNPLAQPLEDHETSGGAGAGDVTPQGPTGA